MKYFVFVLIIVANSLCALAQRKGSGQVQHSAGNETVLGFAEEYDSLPKLAFAVASPDEYNQLPQNRLWTKPSLKVNRGYFFINTSAGKQKFKQYKDDGVNEGWNGDELLGYSPLLHLYALCSNSSAEGIGFSTLFLLDSKNGFRYQIVSWGDWHVSLPVPSANNHFFAYYTNTEYKHKNADLCILSFNPTAEKGKAFEPFASLHSDEFAIEDIRWADDTTLYIKGYEEVYENQQWIKKYQYYKTKIPR
jgi:hypothetical protein